jgi:hypothetical protein
MSPVCKIVQASQDSILVLAVTDTDKICEHMAHDVGRSMPVSRDDTSARDVSTALRYELPLKGGQDRSRCL